MNLKLQKKVRQRRHWRVRKKVIGTADRPRLSVRLSNKHLYVQCIDDEAGKTLVSAHSLSKDARDSKLRPNVAGGTELGKSIAEKAKAAGIESVVFDRGSRSFHGVVKALADAARENGLKF